MVKCKSTSRLQHAFTLVELSIVLVIVGLLVGGVLTGQSLIRAAELRSVTTEYRNYVTAIGAFKDKYLALPGDMPNAVRYWGSAHGTSANDLADGDGNNIDCTTSLPTTNKTVCNGNGDGQISGSEALFAWKDLSNAGLISGSYSATISGSNGQSIPGLDIPKSRMANASWSIYYFSSLGNSNTFLSDWGHALEFGVPIDDSSTYGAVLTPEDALNIDTKLDDGKPDTGRVSPFYSYAFYTSNGFPYCVTSSDDAYNLAVSAKACSLIFSTGY